ncbi:MAG TPA: aldo/keto reductase, partial [Chthonomonadaceae bacterium]|nr:aldo/keto reductase [Chthonomonadaceae bacterium]
SLGATGVRVPLVGYGTAPLGKTEVSPEYAVRCLNTAIDCGVTYLDTSPDYGSEPHLGEVMRARRQEVFLATKVNKRSKEGALESIRLSLERLQTDYVDLIQLHAVNTYADLEQVLAPDGALAGLEQARQEGLARFLGITGHARPEILAEALSRARFDTVLSALGMADHLVSAPDAFLLPQAAVRQVGVIAMKVLGHGHFPDPGLALRYSLGLPGVSLAIIGMNSPQEIAQIVSIAADYRPLEELEEARLIEQVRPLIEQDVQKTQQGQGDLFWLHDTTVMGWQERDAPQRVAY